MLYVKEDELCSFSFTINLNVLFSVALSDLRTAYGNNLCLSRLVLVTLVHFQGHRRIWKKTTQVIFSCLNVSQLSVTRFSCFVFCSLQNFLFVWWCVFVFISLCLSLSLCGGGGVIMLMLLSMSTRVCKCCSACVITGQNKIQWTLSEGSGLVFCTILSSTVHSISLFL